MTQGHDSGRTTRQNITTVSLLDTWEIKENLQREGGNFSRFVRNCLREWARYEQDVPCFREQHPEREILCFPRESRLCEKCWPNGPPPFGDWKSYMGYSDQPNELPELAPHYHDDEWILARAEAASSQDQWTVQDLPWRGRPPKSKVKVKRGILLRMVDFLRF